MIVPESGTTKRTHLAPLYHSDTLVNPDNYIVIKVDFIAFVVMVDCGVVVFYVTLINGKRACAKQKSHSTFTPSGLELPTLHRVLQICFLVLFFKTFAFCITEM